MSPEKTPIREMTLQQLITEYDRTQASIDGNDGRLSTGSSAQLDLDMDDQEVIAGELRRRLGIEGVVAALVQKELRRRQLARRHGALIRVLLRIGLVSRDFDGEIVWPVRVSPRHTWRACLREGVGAFRNLPGIIKWQRGRWLPWRWGFQFFMLEIGDRGSSCAAQDPDRLSLFRSRKGG